MAEAVELAGSRVASTEGRVVLAEVAPNELLKLMDVRARFPEAIVGIRVEEAPLDMVYDQLLQREAE